MSQYLKIENDGTCAILESSQKKLEADHDLLSEIDSSDVVLIR